LSRRFAKASDNVGDREPIWRLLYLEMNEGRLQDIFEDIAGKLGKMNWAPFARGTIGSRLAGGTVFGGRPRFLPGPSFQLRAVQTACLQFASGCPMHASRRSGFDFPTGAAMNNEMTNFGFTLSVEYKTLAVMRNPVKVRPIVVKENNHQMFGAW